jgi:Fe-S-cluster containining protein
LPERELLKPDDPFPFACREGLACFTSCCEDISIFLTPNDVMRLKRGLGVPAKEVLRKYADVYVIKRTGLPIVRLKMGEDAEKRCLLVRPVTGCTVYEDRPWACRMYPLDKVEHGFRLLVDTSRCHGLKEDEPHTVAQWLETQGVPEYEAMDELYSQVTLADPKEMQTDLSPEAVQGLYRLCYDLDELREVLFERGAVEGLPPSERPAPDASDEELLKVALKILNWALVGGLEQGERERLTDRLEKAF